MSSESNILEPDQFRFHFQSATSSLHNSDPIRTFPHQTSAGPILLSSSQIFPVSNHLRSFPDQNKSCTRSSFTLPNPSVQRHIFSNTCIPDASACFSRSFPCASLLFHVKSFVCFSSAIVRLSVLLLPDRFRFIAGQVRPGL